MLAYRAGGRRRGGLGGYTGLRAARGADRRIAGDLAAPGRLASALFRRTGRGGEVATLQVIPVEVSPRLIPGFALGAHGAGEAEMRGAMGGGNPADPETVALIRRLEEALLVPEVRKSAAQIAALLADEFVEIGSSGRIYDKDQIIGQLQQESGEESLRTVSDFTARELADGLILVTYRIIETRTVRSSIWKRTNSEWRMVFHQGTKFM
jgi:hypothetical protein